MGRRLGSLTVFLVVIGVGALLGSALAQWWRWPEPADRGLPAVVESLGRVRVEVKNAGGRPGMAHTATDLLRDFGFDVVYFGNADRFDRDSSVVLDRGGRMEAAQAVADALGIPSVQSAPDENLYLDVTVLLGAEWEPAAAVNPPGSDGGPRWGLTRPFRRDSTR